MGSRDFIAMADTPVQGIALCIGGSACLWSDVEKASLLMWDDVKGPMDVTVFACNNAGYSYPVVHHWVTLHPDKMPHWKFKRVENGYSCKGIEYWTSNVNYSKELEEQIGYKHVKPWHGSSGLLAVSVAIHLGFQKIALAGIPLHKNEKHFDNDKPWNDAHKYRAGWIKHKELMVDKVRSFSGWTKDLLGEPTKEWLLK